MGQDESSEEEFLERDGDLCAYADISPQFVECEIADEKTVVEPLSYVLHLAADRCFTHIAAGTCHNSLETFQIAESKLITSTNIKVEDSNSNKICGVQFAKENDNLVYVGSNNGKIYLFDLRKRERIYTFSDVANDKKIPISCFDINSNDRLLCAGSEQVATDTFLLFFDTRQRKSLGCYCESHTEDITDVRFHPTHPDILATGSTDGLINVFDVAKDSEDDALSVVFNTESSVYKVKWHRNSKEKEMISCITDTHDLKLYDYEEEDLKYEFMRSHISESIRRKVAEWCYPINCHSKQDGSIILLAGSNYKDNVLRSVVAKTGVFKPYGNYVDNKQVVRDSLYHAETNTLVTAGENAMITLWREKPVPNGN